MEGFYRPKEGETRKLKAWIMSVKITIPSWEGMGLTRQIASLVITRKFQIGWFKILLKLQLVKVGIKF